MFFNPWSLPLNIRFVKYLSHRRINGNGPYQRTPSPFSPFPLRYDNSCMCYKFLKQQRDRDSQKPYFHKLSCCPWSYTIAITATHMPMQKTCMYFINTLSPRLNGRHFPVDIFKFIFLFENFRISSKISLKFVPKDPINNIPALVQIMALRRPGDKPLSEPIMVRWPTHICVTRPQWINKTSWKWPGVIQALVFLWSLLNIG